MPITDAITLSPKQREYLRSATHRWNIKCGGVRSGKTFVDLFTIPMRIRSCTGRGLIVLLGSTESTLRRNILDPLRNLWGDDFVGQVSQNNTVRLFGHTCFALGASSDGQAAKLQGAGIEYCYGDEMTTWSEEVFHMLKSRLDLPQSRFDGTCNPTFPDHFIKRFLDSDADIYLQHYTIDDNTALDPAVREAIKTEYRGTPYYDRFIEGLWVPREGSVYPLFAACPDAFTGEVSLPRGGTDPITAGLDFGGSRSATAICAVRIGPGGIFPNGAPGGPARRVCLTALNAARFEEALDPASLYRRVEDFLQITARRYAPVDTLYCDAAEPVLIRGLRQYLAERGLSCAVRPSLKRPIALRIRALNALLARRDFLISPDCAPLRRAIAAARWDPAPGSDRRLDNGSSDIDSLDAFEYAFERFIPLLI